MKQLFLLIALLLVLKTQAQTSQEKLVGDWKSYHKDDISFEFLRLNSNGTGLKCFGQTINGKDTLFQNAYTTLIITKWTIEKHKLIIESSSHVNFKSDPNFTLTFIGTDKIELEGEHLLYFIYPLQSNRKLFFRKVLFQKADKMVKHYGVSTARCIAEQKIFSFKPIDSAIQKAEYVGFEDLIPHLISCNNGSEFTQKYHDPPYSLNVPTSIKTWSFSFGDKLFYISLNSNDNDPIETSIVIYYDFNNEMKDHYFSQIKTGEEKKDIVKLNGFDIYKTKNWQGKYEGKVFLGNSIIVAYYTINAKLQSTLQKCITTFKYVQ
jgi:hypothetical protein